MALFGPRHSKHYEYIRITSVAVGRAEISLVRTSDRGTHLKHVKCLGNECYLTRFVLPTRSFTVSNYEDTSECRKQDATRVRKVSTPILDTKYIQFPLSSSSTTIFASAIGVPQVIPQSRAGILMIPCLLKVTELAEVAIAKVTSSIIRRTPVGTASMPGYHGYLWWHRPPLVWYSRDT